MQRFRQLQMIKKKKGFVCECGKKYLDSYNLYKH